MWVVQPQAAECAATEHAMPYTEQYTDSHSTLACTCGTCTPPVRPVYRYIILPHTRGTPLLYSATATTTAAAAGSMRARYVRRPAQGALLLGGQPEGCAGAVEAVGARQAPQVRAASVLLQADHAAPPHLASVHRGRRRRRRGRVPPPHPATATTAAAAAATAAAAAAAPCQWRRVQERHHVVLWVGGTAIHKPKQGGEWAQAQLPQCVQRGAWHRRATGARPPPLARCHTPVHVPWSAWL